METVKNRLPDFVVHAHCGARQHAPDKARSSDFKITNATGIAGIRSQDRVTKNEHTPGRHLHNFHLPVLLSSQALARQQRREIQRVRRFDGRSEEHTSELQSLMRISYAVFCLKKKKNQLK